MASLNWNASSAQNEDVSGNTASFPGASGNDNGVRAQDGIAPGQSGDFTIQTKGFYAGSAYAVGASTGDWPLGHTGDGNGGLTGNGDVMLHWDGIVDVNGNWTSNPHRASATMQDGGTATFHVDNTPGGKVTWSAGGESGSYDIPGNGSQTVYPTMSDGTGGGPSSVLQSYNISGSGSGSAGSSTPATATASVNTNTVSQPASAKFVAPTSSNDNTTPPPKAGAAAVSVDQPSSLHAGMQSITGTVSDPTQAVWLDWHTSGTPTANDNDWVKASVDKSGHFSASVDIDHAGVSSSMFYRIGDSGSAQTAFSGTPN